MFRCSTILRNSIPSRTNNDHYLQGHKDIACNSVFDYLARYNHRSSSLPYFNVISEDMAQVTVSEFVSILNIFCLSQVGHRFLRANVISRHFSVCPKSLGNDDRDIHQLFLEQIVCLFALKAESIKKSISSFTLRRSEHSPLALVGDTHSSLTFAASPQSRSLPFKRGDVLILSPASCRPEIDQFLVGVVGKKNSIVGALPFHETTVTHNSLVPMSSWKSLKIDFLENVFTKELSALKAVCSQKHSLISPIVRFMFSSSVTSPLPPTSKFSRGFGFNKISQDFLYNLTKSQSLAVSAASSSDLTLIQGPPGTGKTKVAVAIVKQWLASNRFSPILVTAGTQAACKLLEDRLISEGIKVRANKFAWRYGGVFVETVYSAAIPSNRIFPRVIVDEAVQLSDISTLVSLAQGAEKIVLIGDPKQLQSVCKRESLFERLEKKQGIFPIFLDTQFRMHPDICKFPSRRFYGGKLQSHEFPGNFPVFKFPLPEKFLVCESAGPSSRVVFIDTSESPFKQEDYDPSTSSYCNRLESSLVLHVVHSILDSGEEESEIGVVTGYSSQRSLIVSKIHKNLDMEFSRFQRDSVDSLPGPTVDSVDAFQGGERKWIIVSATRSNENGSVGFLSDERRMNVMLTRAKEGLVVIGDSKTLAKNNLWSEWISFVRNEGTVYRVAQGVENAMKDNECSLASRKWSRNQHA